MCRCLSVHWFCVPKSSFHLVRISVCICSTYSGFFRMDCHLSSWYILWECNVYLSYKYIFSNVVCLRQKQNHRTTFIVSLVAEMSGQASAACCFWRHGLKRHLVLTGRIGGNGTKFTSKTSNQNERNQTVNTGQMESYKKESTEVYITDRLIGVLSVGQLLFIERVVFTCKQVVLCLSGDFRQWLVYAI